MIFLVKVLRRRAVNSIIDAIFENSELFPEKVAISYENSKITYFEL